MQTLKTYLTAVKTRKTNPDLIIMGNEAADLDSMASSIAYGYLHTLKTPGAAALPVMPIARADFHLRTEAVFVMKEAGINPDDLVFFDEIDAASLLVKTPLVLVDHNSPSPELEKFQPKVTGIVDHHSDDGNFSDAQPRIIQTIGSTTSIIARLFMDAGFTISSELAVLLGGTILLDTVNLDDSAGRVTDADKEIAAHLLPLCPLSREDFFSQVQKAKFSVQGLSTNDLLRKDYKQWMLGKTLCGIGSALIALEDWARMDSDLSRGFEDFTVERKLDILFSMNAFTNPDFHRHLVIYTKTQAEHDRLLVFLQENGLDLKLMNLEGQKKDGAGYIQFYEQGNLKISRKKLHPILKDFFNES